MPIISTHKNDVGLKRTQNEDYIWVDEPAGLYIVADGMGGQEAGEVASHMAATTVGQFMVKQLKAEKKPFSSETIRELMIDSIEQANRTVFEAAQAAGHERGMGTTIVMALVQSPTVYISHVGDSRAYLAQGSSLTQLTEDDSWAIFADKVAGLKEKVAEYMQSVLTKAVGQSDTPLHPSFSKVTLNPGDAVLLCSDGLWNMVADEQILAELQKAGDRLDQAAEAMIAAANAAGGKDNISIIIIKRK
jgi:protein phosphatase